MGSSSVLSQPVLCISVFRKRKFWLRINGIVLNYRNSLEGFSERSNCQYCQKNIEMGEGGEDLSLEQTPTWAVAVVCLAFLVISLIIERAIHRVGNWLYRGHKKTLYEALEKVKSELMLLGFISLLLAVGEKPISTICITESENSAMLPCKKRNDDVHNDYCSKHGKYPLISQTGMNQLHIFIFTLAVIHVLFSGLIIALGRAQMKRWRAWESDTETLEYQFSHDPERFRLTHQTSFVRRHLNFWSRTPILKWVVCFFRQFFWSIKKVDYLTLRHGFIVAHLPSDRKFDFHKYIKRSLDDDFKRVIGISPPLWAFAVAFLLINVYGWHTLFWVSFVPAIIVLLVGLKLQLIIIEMASEIQERNPVVKGAPVVQLTDKLFWFGRPELVLVLIHFSLFQNAFQLAFFLWIWWQFGLRSCFHDKFYGIITRLVTGIAVQFMCSYVTLPLYALVTQMGSHMKPAIFEDHVVHALRRWHQKAKKSSKRNERSESGFSSRTGVRSGETTPSRGSSPLHLLHKYNSMGTIETSPGRGSSPLHSMHKYNNMGDIQILNISPLYDQSEHAVATPSPGSSPSHLMHKYNSMSDIETPNISGRYEHSEHAAANAVVYTEIKKQHSISKRVKTSNVEIAAAFSYPLEPTKTVLSGETSGSKETPEQHPTSTDVNTNAGEFSFATQQMF